MILENFFKQKHYFVNGKEISKEEAEKIIAENQRAIESDNIELMSNIRFVAIVHKKSKENLKKDSRVPAACVRRQEPRRR